MLFSKRIYLHILRQSMTAGLICNYEQIRALGQFLKPTVEKTQNRVIPVNFLGYYQNFHEIF